MTEKPWDAPRFEEKENGFEFFLSNTVVIFMQFGGSNIDLSLDDNFSTYIRLAMPFVWKQGNHAQVFDPEKALNPAEVLTLAPLLSLMRKRIAKVEATKTGFLFITFEDGDEVKVPSDEEGHIYEAWQIGDRHDFLAVCAVGGGISIFLPQDKRLLG